MSQIKFMNDNQSFLFSFHSWCQKNIVLNKKCLYTKKKRCIRNELYQINNNSQLKIRLKIV